MANQEETFCISCNASCRQTNFCDFHYIKQLEYAVKIKRLYTLDRGGHFTVYIPWGGSGKMSQMLI